MQLRTTASGVGLVALATAWGKAQAQEPAPTLVGVTVANAGPQCTSDAAPVRPLARAAGAVAAVARVLMPVILLLSATPGAAEPPDVRTELERLKVELLQAKAQLVLALRATDECRVELAPVRTQLNARAIEDEAARLAAELEAAHPGHTFNRKTGQLDPRPPTP